MLSLAKIDSRMVIAEKATHSGITAEKGFTTHKAGRREKAD
jgi:hypothetical protein